MHSAANQPSYEELRADIAARGVLANKPKQPEMISMQYVAERNAESN